MSVLWERLREWAAPAAVAFTVWCVLAVGAAAVLPVSPLLSAAVALAWVALAASLRSQTWWGRGLRYSSFPVLGLAVVARSDYWVQPAFETFRRLLTFEAPLGWWEPLGFTEDWWKVALVGLGFVGFYALYSRWPELAAKPRASRRSALAVCAATQLVILTAITVSTVTAVALSLLLAGVVAIALCGELRAVFLPFFFMAPAYAGSNHLVLVAVSVLSAGVLYGLGRRYPPKTSFASAFRRALLTGLLLAPLSLLPLQWPVAGAWLAVVACSLVVATARAVFPAPASVEVTAATAGVWLALVADATLTAVGLSYLCLLALALLSTAPWRGAAPGTLVVKALLLWFVAVLTFLNFGTLSPYPYLGTLALALACAAWLSWGPRSRPPALATAG